MELSVENTRAAKDSQVAQVTLRTKHAILRAEEASSDMFASVDMVLEKMQRQIDRYKGKRGSKRSIGEEAVAADEEEGAEEETGDEDSHVFRVKRFPLTPMDEEEAIDQMELLGHDFYVFYNVDETQVNVVYRRRNGDYGVIKPEMR